MAYSTYNEHRHPEIEPFLDELEGLESSGKYWIRGLSITQQNSIRYQLYTWMHSKGIKPLFRIQSFPGELLITKRGLPSSVTTQLEVPPLAARLEELLNLALSTKDPGALLRAKQEEGKLTTEEMGSLLDRLGRILE